MNFFTFTPQLNYKTPADKLYQIDLFVKRFWNYFEDEPWEGWGVFFWRRGRDNLALVDTRLDAIPKLARSKGFVLAKGLA